MGTPALRFILAITVSKPSCALRASCFDCLASPVEVYQRRHPHAAYANLDQLISFPWTTLQWDH